MKILRVASDLYPEVIGGNAIHVHEMSKKQAELGHEIVVYTVNRGNGQNEEIRDGYKIIKVNKFAQIFGNPICPSLFFKLLSKRYNFNIIHAHSHLYFSTNICATVKKLGSPPLVITNHGLESASASKNINNIYLKTLGKYTLQMADNVICYTEMEKERLNNLLNVDYDKITVIPNGVDTDLFCPNIDKYLEDESPKILWVGRLVPGKGVEYLIRSIGILAKNIPKIKVLLVGEGPQKSKLLDLIANLKLKENISMLDHVENKKMPIIYQKSDVFVLPSLNEGVPRTILEAMSCGIPVVCSEIPHLSSIIDECGIMVPQKDAVAMAGAIHCIISDSDHANKLGRNGRKRVARNYSWANTVEKTVALYKGLI